MNAYWNAPISDPLSSLCARVFSPAAAILENPEDEVAKGQFYSQLHRLQNHFPNLPNFSLPLVSQQQSKPTLLNKTRSYKRQFNLLLTWSMMVMMMMMMMMMMNDILEIPSKARNLKEMD